MANLSPRAQQKLVSRRFSDLDSLRLRYQEDGAAAGEMETDGESINRSLHAAMIRGNYGDLEWLLRAGADISSYNGHGYSVLQWAVANKDAEAVELVLSHGADVNQITSEPDGTQRTRRHFEAGIPIIQLALSNPNTECLRLLSKAGIDLSPPSLHPWSAQDLLLLVGDWISLHELLTHGAKVELPDDDDDDVKPDGRVAEHAKQLLRCTDIMATAKSRELHGTYKHALRRIRDESHLLDFKQNDVSGLVLFRQKLHSTLRDMAGVEPIPNVNICASCRAFQIHAAYSLRGQLTDSEYYVLHSDRQHLVDSAQQQGCILCAFIADALDNAEAAATTQVADGRRPPAKNPYSSLPPRDTSSKSVQLGVDSIDAYMNRGWIDVACGKIGAEITVASLSSGLVGGFDEQPVLGMGNGSVSALQTAKRWFLDCQSGQDSACRKACEKFVAATPDQHPKRLLYVGSDRVRLIETTGNERYFALSYCWGKNDFLSTTKSNLIPHMTQGIALSDLATIIADAIAVTRTLKHEFIWVDALCIVQDDIEDWRCEAAKMNSIYMNATLTISTVMASDSHGNLFRPRRARIVRPVPLAYIPFAPVTNAAVFPVNLQERSPCEGPVHTRAWTLQEQLLSLRILWFGDGIVQWDCLCGYKFETDPGQDDWYNKISATLLSAYEYRLEFRREAKSFIWGIDTFKARTKIAPSAYRYWMYHAEEFMSRDITRASDRVPAFEPIARNLVRRGGGEWRPQHSLGIFTGSKEELEGLCWRVKAHRSDSKGLLSPSPLWVPSWSWLGADGPISLDFVDMSGVRHATPPYRAVVVRFDIHPTLPQGERRGSVTLRGTMHKKPSISPSLVAAIRSHPLQLRRQGQEQGKRWGEHASSSFSSSPPQLNMVSLDHDVDGPLDNIYALDLFSTFDGREGSGIVSRVVLSGSIQLLLQPVTTGVTMFFRRVGICKATFLSLPEEKDSLRPHKSVRDWLLSNEKSQMNTEVTMV